MLKRVSIFLGGLLSGLLASGLLLLLIRPHPRYPIELIPPPSPGPIRIHVAGAVEQPGVVQLAHDAIVEQAIIAAGGPTDGADLSRLNLAEALKAGQQIYVPSREATSPESRFVTVDDPTPSQKININTASEAQLEHLPGIGPTLATNIVEYRDQHGWFQEPEELLNISGIGPAKLEQIQELIIFH